MSLSGAFVCCRPCAHYIAKRRIRREYEDKLRAKAYEKAKELEEEKKKLDAEAALAAAFEKERTRHLKLKGGKTLSPVPMPKHLVPEGAEALGIATLEMKSVGGTESSRSESEGEGEGEREAAEDKSLTTTNSELERKSEPSDASAGVILSPNSTHKRGMSSKGINKGEEGRGCCV